jgi:hypothetical protein
LAGAGPADAGTLFAGLSKERTLTLIDLDRARVIWQVNIKGIGHRVLGFDLRPADDQLWGAATSQQVSTMDPQSGNATLKSRLS